MKAALISVNYGDLLAITLPRNAAYFEHIVIGTTPADSETQEIASKFSNVTLHITEDFYAHGAKFNKGLVMEQCLDKLGRDGWITIMDADIVLPPQFASYNYKPGLTTPFRRMLYTPQSFSDSLDWSLIPLLEESGWWGYCQIFNGNDPLLAHRPWYPIDWAHAGGSDHDFQNRWPAKQKHRPSFQVLHLGENLKNWFGRATPRVDGTLSKESQTAQEDMSRLIKHRRKRRKWHQKTSLERINLPENNQ